MPSGEVPDMDHFHKPCGRTTSYLTAKVCACLVMSLLLIKYAFMTCLLCAADCSILGETVVDRRCLLLEGESDRKKMTMQYNAVGDRYHEK